MKISSPSRKTNARKPSHLGSKIHAPAAGNSLTRLASIGKTVGCTGSCTSRVYNPARAGAGRERGSKGDLMRSTGIVIMIAVVMLSIAAGQTAVDQALQAQLKRVFPAASSFSAKQTGPPPHYIA